MTDSRQHGQHSNATLLQTLIDDDQVGYEKCLEKSPNSVTWFSIP